MNHFIEKKVEPFCVQAYHNGEFKEITEKNLLGKWSIFFFYPAEAISQFMWDYTCFNAALKIGTQLLSQSLLDYMR